MLTDEDVARQEAEVPAGFGGFTVNGEVVEFECGTIAITCENGNVTNSIIDPGVNISNRCFFAIQTQRELQESVNNGQSDEILSTVRFGFVLSIPNQQAVWFLGREQQGQQNVLFIWTLHQSRAIQFDESISFVLTREFDWRTVLANVAGEMDGTVAYVCAAFALANATVFTWIMGQACINDLFAIVSTVAWFAISRNRLFDIRLWKGNE